MQLADSENILDTIEYDNFFGDTCPLWGALDGARFIGFYYRGVVDGWIQRIQGQAESVDENRQEVEQIGGQSEILGTGNLWANTLI